MKKWIALICAFCLLWGALPVQAETAWSSDEWNQTVSRLYSADPAPVPASYRIPMKQSQLYLADPAEQKSGWLNMALISTDAPDMRENYGRSEALLVCRINQKTGEFRLLSLPEYMNVQIAGLPSEIQLKHANCFGGPLLALDTVNRELGLSINRYCAVNVDSFAGIIDIAGGVTLTLTAEESEALGLGQGAQTLTGADAVRYLKLRRQWDGALRFRILLEALLRQMSGAGMISGVLSLVDAMLHMIDTNLTMDEIVTFAFALLDQQEMQSIQTYRLEADGEGRVDEAAALACRDFLYGGASGK
jgi:LCP family protein required for cell wall assembly